MLPIEVHSTDFEWLTENEYIETNVDDVNLTEKGLAIFEGNEDLFLKFFEIYPYKVSNGTGGVRILGTKDATTIFGKRMYRKWNTATKGNVKLQESMIKGLENELAYRKKSNGMQYMQNMDTWLNQGTWEKYQEGESIQTNREKLI